MIRSKRKFKSKFDIHDKIKNFLCFCHFLGFFVIKPNFSSKLINYLKFNSGLYPEYNEYFSSPGAFFDCLTFGTEGIAPDRGQPKVNISFR